MLQPDSTPWTVAESTVQFAVGGRRRSGAGSVCSGSSPRPAVSRAFLGLSDDELAASRVRSLQDFVSTLPAVELPAIAATPGCGSVDPVDLYHWRESMPLGVPFSARPRAPSICPARPAGVPVVEVPEALRDRLLGILTEFAAIGSESGQKRSGDRFDLQEVAQKLLPLHRVESCLKHRLPEQNVRVLYSPVGGAHYGGIMRCGSVWACPVCAAKIAEKRRQEIEQAIAVWSSRGYSVFMLTLTFAHGRHDDLAAMLEGFLKALRSMLQNRAYRDVRSQYLLKHSIRALETTWSDLNGWHPHAHLLLFSELASPETAPATAALETSMQAAIYAAWSAALGRVGLSAMAGPGVKVQVTKGAVADYVAKFGREKKGDNPRYWGVADEVTKSHVKVSKNAAGLTPFDLLRWHKWDQSGQAAALFAEYVEAFAGRSQLQWSRGLRDALALGVEQSDLELVTAPEEEAVLVLELRPAEWGAVLEHKARAKVLQIGELNDPALLRRYIDALVLASGSAVAVERRRQWLNVRR